MRAGCRGALLLQLLDAYAVRYSEMLDGRSEHLPVSELAGGARIRHIFLDIFVNGLQELNPSRRARSRPPSLVPSPPWLIPSSSMPLLSPVPSCMPDSSTKGAEGVQAFVTKHQRLPGAL